MKGSLLLVVLALSATGCFRTTIRSGTTPGASPPGYHERWHSGYIGGLIEGSGPHELGQLCPGGWSQIDTKTEPVDLALTITTSLIYTPQVVTVACQDPRARKRAVAKSPPPRTYPTVPAPGAPPDANLEEH